jgi:hypothetical protein
MKPAATPVVTRSRIHAVPLGRAQLVVGLAIYIAALAGAAETLRTTF